MTVETVGCVPDVMCSLTVVLGAECPIKDEFDKYRVTVSWRPGEETFEKWSLREWIMGFEGRETTQEELTKDLFDGLDVPEIESLEVSVTDVKHMKMTTEVQR